MSETQPIPFFTWVQISRVSGPVNLLDFAGFLPDHEDPIFKYWVTGLFARLKKMTHEAERNEIVEEWTYTAHLGMVAVRHSKLRIRREDSEEEGYALEKYSYTPQKAIPPPYEDL